VAARIRRGRAGGHQIQDVPLLPGIGQEAREVLQPFRIAQPRRLPFERDRPVVTLATKDGVILSMRTWLERPFGRVRTLDAGLRRSCCRTRGSYPLNRLAGGALLEAGALLLAFCA
jgi:hypothetical protein